ncbi:MAG: precorrin-3B synthase [Geminocystis sp.]|nr:precorrin-3B synthase [Geminocystis sp.]MCS7148010.1 precorrin-3B synthase [Geminocystis sp.]MCX8078985.1 precorrin-3B synthase [Geminocystis sp.]MDW8116910.1 precorrin-3B synthase [Geminocystis sp.]MDW8462553.1 precorrin-3B synthase [Geminocystis sp.]
MNWPLPAKKCPGLYYGTEAKDGFLLRIRVAGGILTLPQMEAIELLLDCCKQEKIQVTNRGNLQLRGLTQSPPNYIYQKLQEVGLASRQLQIDHLRNIMISPTAGIDAEELVDTRVWLKQIITYMEDNPNKIATLPAKFSIGIDGGGIVGIGSRPSVLAYHRYNEIQFTATRVKERILFHLEFGGRKTLIPTGILIPPEYLITCLDSLIEIYRQHINSNIDSKKVGHRLPDLIQQWGVSEYWRRVTEVNSFPYETKEVKLPPTPSTTHLGLYRQKQEGLYYLGVAPSLGYITKKQWRGLMQLVEKTGCGEIRLTPWQSIIIPNLSDDTTKQTTASLEELGLSVRENNSRGKVVACVGKTGCKAAITESETHARVAIGHLQGRKQDKHPITIHFSGCGKCCAQTTPATLSFIGCWLWRDGKAVEGYKIYHKESLIASLAAEKAISLLPELLKSLDS